MKFLLIVFSALAFAATANAALPGTHEETRLEPAASFVAGRTVRIYCANDFSGWELAVQAAYPQGPPGGLLPGGFAYPTLGEAYISPRDCGALLNPASVTDRQFGSAVLALAHESVHLSGVADEWATDCTALSDVWGVAGLYFGVGWPQLGEVYAGALKRHLSAPPQYVRSGSC